MLQYEYLSGVKGIKLMEVQPDVLPNYAYYAVLFDEDEFGESRDAVCERLKANEIYARKYFYPAVNEMDCYENANKTPVAARISRQVLTLPMYADLSIEDVDRICDVVLNV